MAILRGLPEPTQWRGYLASLDWSTSQTVLVACQRQVRLSQGGYWAQIPRETSACEPGRTFLWEPSLLLCGHHIAARPGSRVGWGIMNECLKGNRYQNSFCSSHRGPASRTCGLLGAVGASGCLCSSMTWQARIMKQFVSVAMVLSVTTRLLTRNLACSEKSTENWKSKQ